MQGSDRQNREPPEKLIARLSARLRAHVAGDLALVHTPPLLAILYITLVLYREAWLDRGLTIGLVGAALVATAGLTAYLYRKRMPGVNASARLLDEKARADDRFLTLATVEPGSAPQELLARLRREAASLGKRIALERDFRYKPKRSFHRSWIASTLAVVLFQLVLPLAQSRAVGGGAIPETLVEIAERLAARPELGDLAVRVLDLTSQLQTPQTMPPERKAEVEKLIQELEERKERESRSSNRELLEQAANTLKGLEHESRSGGGERQETTGGAGERERQQQETGGEGSASQGGGDADGEVSAAANPESREDKAARPDPQQSGPKQNQRTEGETKSDQADGGKRGSQERTETAGKSQGNAEGKLGQSRSDEIPRGEPPAERFVKAGEEGRPGLKGAGYVTVQLPEELVPEGGGSNKMREAREARARPKIPVSNVPLPPHLPDAPKEKQHLPLEYRAVIR